MRKFHSALNETVFLTREGDIGDGIHIKTNYL